MMGSLLALLSKLQGSSCLTHVGREGAARLGLSRLSIVEGDATSLAGYIVIGSVFFLNCPFSGQRLERVLAELEPIARTRPIRVCCVDVPLPPCPWLTLASPPEGNLAVYRSTYATGPSDERP